MTRFDFQKFRKDLLTKRINSNLDLRSCAKQIGISAPTISRLERCMGFPDLVSFMACCDWMEKPPARYFKKEDK